MGTEKKSLYSYIEATESARQSGDKDALRDALQAQKDAFQNEIDTPGTNPQRKNSFAKDIANIEKELNTLPQRSRSSASAAPPKPLPQVPTLPAATSKWKDVKEKVGDTLSNAFKTLQEIQNTGPRGPKAEGKQSAAPSKPLPPTPTGPKGPQR